MSSRTFGICISTPNVPFENPDSLIKLHLGSFFSAALHSLSGFHPLALGMAIAQGQYWNGIYCGAPEEAFQDAEGMQQMLTSESYGRDLPLR